MPRLLGSPRLPTAPRGERQRLKSAAEPRVLGWRSSWWPGLRQGGDVEGPVSRWTWLDLGGPSAAEKICILWDRVGGGSGEDKGATGPAEKQVSAGVEQRNSPSKKGAQRVGCERSALRLSGVSAWRHQSQGPNEILPAEGPSLIISLRPLPVSHSCFTGDGGRALPNATSSGKRQTGPVSSVNGGKKKKIPPTCILWSWGLCPHFAEADN